MNCRSEKGPIYNIQDPRLIEPFSARIPRPGPSSVRHHHYHYQTYIYLTMYCFYCTILIPPVLAIPIPILSAQHSIFLVPNTINSMDVEPFGF